MAMNPFQRIIDTVSNAVSILDFSYTVSGGATLAVILFDCVMFIKTIWNGC